MENTKVKVQLKLINRCKYIAAVSVITILKGNTKCDWEFVQKSLKDRTLYYKFHSLERYIMYIVNSATKLKYPFVMNRSILHNELFERFSANLERYFISFEEYKMIMEIYFDMLDKAVQNARENYIPYDFKIKIKVNEIAKVYADLEVPDLEKVEYFMMAFDAFFIYNLLIMHINHTHEVVGDEVIITFKDLIRI
ncbi:MAG: hypothetical protein IJ809_05255 [Clostridia bacterium]|nr:hypothetical protein [Clostridia bacterium]